MKKIISFLLAVLTVFSVLTTVISATVFEDVEDGKWYTEGIRFCDANGYMSGTSETVFDRNSALNRAMFMTVLAKIDGVDLSPYEGVSDFTDVKTDGWYTSAIGWAVEIGVTSGIGDGVFGYKNPVTREQMALIMYGYSEYVNRVYLEQLPEESEPALPIDTTLGADLSVFEDEGRIHDWAREAMEWAVAVGLISGTGENTLSPRGNCTRAQAAVIIKAFVCDVLSNCEHEWVNATCDADGYCKNCDLLLSFALGHEYRNFNCQKRNRCQRCGYRTERGEHTLTEYTCTQSSVCLVCGHLEKYANGHDFSGGICKDCGIYEDEGNPYSDFFRAMVATGSIYNGSDSFYGFTRRGKDKYGFDMTCSIYVNKHFFKDGGDWYNGEINIVYTTVDPKSNNTFSIHISLHTRSKDLYCFVYLSPLGELYGNFTNKINKNGDFTLYRVSNVPNTANSVALAKIDIIDALAYAEELLRDNTDLSLTDLGFDPAILHVNDNVG